MNDLHVSIATSLHEMCPYQAQFTIFRVLTDRFLLKPLSRSLSDARSTHSKDHCRLQVHILQDSRSLRSLRTPTQTQSHLHTPTVQFHRDSIPSVDPTPSTTTTKHACEMSAEHPLSKDHTTVVQLLYHRAFEHLLLPPRSWRVPRSLTREQQRQDASTHSIPHRRENNWNDCLRNSSGLLDRGVL